MSSRRKRAPLVKVDEETKKKLCWNMHEDLKNDNITSEAGNVPVPNSLAAPLIIEDDITLEEGCSIAVKDRVSSPRNFSGLTVLLHSICHLHSNHYKGAAALEGEEVITEEPNFSSRDVYSVECSLDSTVLEDLMWFQKRRVVQLYQIHSEDSDFLKVGIFLLESGLGRPEFLSDGSGRIRKSNQLIQNLLELFYDFIIPDLQEDEKEESDTDLERQNIEELYDYVRCAHQNEAHSLKQDIQHPALIPVLRPYQCVAVNWMLKRENYKSSQTHALRAMLLTAIKEMRVGKGASVNTISMYIRATYRSDLQRNRHLIKKTKMNLFKVTQKAVLEEHSYCGQSKDRGSKDITLREGVCEPLDETVVKTHYNQLIDADDTQSHSVLDMIHNKCEPKAAEMALKLSAINHCCVSGTPVQRGLEDLYGLVLFHGVDLYWVKHWWEQLLYHPYRRGNPHPLYSVIARLMWRSTKKDVLDQIQIPPQTEEVHWLHFSPVEGHLYHRQHKVCSQDALVKLRKISDWNLKLGSLDRRTVNSILYPLLRLRQACCHPRAVRGEFLPSQKRNCLTMCEYALAAEWYREVLRSSEEHKDKLKTDSLQRLHATHNLMELLEAHRPGIPPTLRDDRLKVEAEQLRQHYMTKSNSEVAEAQQTLQPVLKNIKELKRKVRQSATSVASLPLLLADELFTDYESKLFSHTVKGQTVIFEEMIEDEGDLVDDRRHHDKPWALGSERDGTSNEGHLVFCQSPGDECCPD
ncbi:UNVERIFIED_CONTAM: hypothetical protein FKN15_013513 [Acipenser sinensis]